MAVGPVTITRILDATYLRVNPVCPDCGHAFKDATLTEIEAHITAVHLFDYDHCRVCGTEVNERVKAHARRHIENAHCGSTACIRKEIIATYGCCEKAELTPCVCMYSFTCPDHGSKHVGTHD